MTYREKLKDPRWQKKRLEILQRDEFTCTVCGDSESQLHIHHLYYVGDPWEAPGNALTTLCECCHDLFHEQIFIEFTLILKDSNVKAYYLTKDGRKGIALFSKIDNKYSYSCTLRVNDFEKILSSMIEEAGFEF